MTAATVPPSSPRRSGPSGPGRGPDGGPGLPDLLEPHAGQVDALERRLPVDRRRLDAVHRVDAVDAPPEHGVDPVELGRAAGHDEERRVGARGVVAARHRHDALHVRRVA
ncbi:MAG: hypothetical protein OXG35_01505, partial [Acidobacteria bacterium]|nr:hypothetical protein [Acidobacteriota bacterium]